MESSSDGGEQAPPLFQTENRFDDTIIAIAREWLDHDELQRQIWRIIGAVERENEEERRVRQMDEQREQEIREMLQSAAAQRGISNTGRWPDASEELVIPEHPDIRLRYSDIETGTIDFNPSWAARAVNPMGYRNVEERAEILPLSEIQRCGQFTSQAWDGFYWDGFYRDVFGCGTSMGQGHVINSYSSLVIINADIDSIDLSCQSTGHVGTILYSDAISCARTFKTFCDTHGMRQVLHVMSGARNLSKTQMFLYFLGGGKSQAQKPVFIDKESLINYLVQKNKKNQVNCLFNDGSLRKWFTSTTVQNLGYLNALVSQTGEDISNWNIVEMFFDLQGQCGLSRGDINRIFFGPRAPNDYLDFEKVQIDDQAERIKNDMKALSETSFNALKNSFTQSLRESENIVNRSFDEYKTLYKQYCVHQRLHQYFQGSDKTSPEYTKSQIEKIIASGLFEYVRVDGANLVLRTLKDVVCRVTSSNASLECSSTLNAIFKRYCGTQNGFEVNYGRYEILVDLNTFEVRLRKNPFGQVPYDYYVHHYCPRNDRLCFGLESPKQKEYFKQNDLSNLLRLVWELLTSYEREGNPHRRFVWAVSIHSQEKIVEKLNAIFDLYEKEFDEDEDAYFYSETVRSANGFSQLWTDYMHLISSSNMGVGYDFIERKWRQIEGGFVDPFVPNRAESMDERDEDNVEEDADYDREED